MSFRFIVRRRTLFPLFAWAAVAPAVFGAELPGEFFDSLSYRHIGPIGNRVIAVTGVPGDRNLYYVGAASGGIFRSEDAGHTWEPVFDDMPASSIGSLAVAPSDRNVVWAGTGETFLRANISIGNGIYRSTDAGETWEHRGLDATGRIGRVVVHPENPDQVWACALGTVYGPQEDRGVFRTLDGGLTWERVLFVDPDTGCSDLAIDPVNPRFLYAGMWQVQLNTWSRKSGGPGSGLWRSRDGGETWEELEGSGLPEPPLGKIGLTISADRPETVYALIETSSNQDFAPADPFPGVLWRSDDRGGSWTRVSSDLDLISRPLYYTRMLASPTDADELHFMGASQRISLDGGVTNESADPQPGYDHHDLWIDPADPDRRIAGHDGGVSITTNGGETWYRPQLPIAQMYHGHVDDRIPYWVYGNRQDGPSMRGPSNTRTGGEIPIGAWHEVGGCETGFAVPDPVDQNVVWTGCYDGILERHDLATGHSRDVSVWPEAIEIRPAEDLKYRFQWTFPVAISPHDHERVFVGSQYVHRTTNGGQSWEIVSPDLTSADPELMKRTGGLTLDDASPTIAPAIFALAVSPIAEGEIWAGANDGSVQVTRDGGESWTDRTPNLPASVPPRGTVSNIEPSRHRAGTAYLTIDRHQLGDTEPYVLRTRDHGATWQRIDAGIPRSVFSYAHCVREDPVRPGLLYLGTENAVWVSFDDGGSWQELRSNLPHAPVHWLTVQERFSDLVVTTYGRGYWILDDVTPLRHVGEEIPGELPVLLPPRDAWRFRRVAESMSQPGDPAAGENPEYGASLHYYLPEEVSDETDLSLVILDASGAEVAEIEDPARGAGLHRVHWDLRSKRTREVRLRTKPEGHAWVDIPDEKGWRPIEDGGRISILQPPGEYTVRLTSGDTVLERPLRVLKDPNSVGTEADIATQTALLGDLYAMQERTAATIGELEWVRTQLDGLKARLEDTPRDDVESLVEQIEVLDGKAEEIESGYFDLRLTGHGQDSLRWERRIYAKLAYLAWQVGGSDHPPTDQHLEVRDELREELEALEARHRAFVEQDLAGFEALVAERGLPRVLTGLADPGARTSDDDDDDEGSL